MSYIPQGNSANRKRETMTPDRSEKHLQDLVRELVGLPRENEWVEFKTNKWAPQDIGDYISALSNSAALHGKAYGYIVWGIDDRTHDIVGTTFKLSREKKGGEELENWLLRGMEPKLDFYPLEFTIDNKEITLIEIPCAYRSPVRFRGQAFIRVGSYKKLLKDYPEKERQLWRKLDQTPFEEQICAGHVSTDEVIRLLDAESYFRLIGLPIPDNDKTVVSRFEADRLIRSSDNGQWNILALGAILFARNLNDFPNLARKTVRVVEYKDRDRLHAGQEFQGHKGYAAGYEGLIKFVNSLIPKNEVIGQALRRTVKMYPELAIRELIANSLIHQDFSMAGAGPLIELFADRIEITNPGQPLVDTNRFVDTPPHSRNEALASFMRRIGVCEERGSGIDKVVAETELYQLPAPLFEVAGDQTRCVLFAHQEFETMNRADRVRACYLHACLQYVKRETMTNSSLRLRFGNDSASSSQVSKIIKDTIDVRLIKRPDFDSGSRRHACYIPFWA